MGSGRPSRRRPSGGFFSLPVWRTPATAQHRPALPAATRMRPGAPLDSKPDPGRWYPAWEEDAGAADPVAAPMGGGYSTAGDLVRFADALTGAQLLRRPTSERATTGYVAADYGGREGYGFETRVMNKVRILGTPGRGARTLQSGGRLPRPGLCPRRPGQQRCGRRAGNREPCSSRHHWLSLERGRRGHRENTGIRVRTIRPRRRCGRHHRAVLSDLDRSPGCHARCVLCRGHGPRRIWPCPGPGGIRITRTEGAPHRWATLSCSPGSRPL